MALLLPRGHLGGLVFGTGGVGGAGEGAWTLSTVQGGSRLGLETVGKAQIFVEKSIRLQNITCKGVPRAIPGATRYRFNAGAPTRRDDEH
eukprot:COSAG02_NODE_2443_length_8852_cov_63.348795_9_plen_90_part_00